LAVPNQGRHTLFSPHALTISNIPHLKLMAMQDQQTSLRASLLQRAEQLKQKIEDYMISGKEFHEVKEIYGEFKEVLSQLDGVDRRAQLARIRERDK
jgi:hypothetical protein